MNGDTNGIDEPTEHLKILIENIANTLNFKSFDFKITFKFEKGENYLGEIQRATVNGVKQNGEKEELKLIIKTPPPDQNLRGRLGLNAFYKREIYSYNVLLKTLDKLQDQYNITDKDKFKHAKCYASSSTEFTEVLVFDDLNAKGFKMYDRLIPLDNEHLMLVVKTLARYHALSFAAKDKLSKEVYDDFKEHVSDRNDMGDEMSNYFNDVCASVMDILEDDGDKAKLEKFVEGDVTEKYYEYLNIVENPVDSPYFIITHGDSWINNMLFKYEDEKPSELILVDWQIIKYASPITDLVYLLFSCTDEEMRCELWNEILDTYYNSLKSRLTELDCDPEKCFPETIFREHVTSYLGFGLLMGIGIIPLVLNNREDSINLTDMMTDEGIKADCVKFSKECIARLQGIVRHSAKLNVI